MQDLFNISLHNFALFLDSGNPKHIKGWKLWRKVTQKEVDMLICKYMDSSGDKKYSAYRKHLEFLEAKKAKYVMVQALVLVCLSTTKDDERHVRSKKNLRKFGFISVGNAEMWLKRERIEIEVADKKHENLIKENQSDQVTSYDVISKSLIRLSQFAGYEMTMRKSTLYQYCVTMELMKSDQEQQEKALKKHKQKNGR